MLRSLLSLNNFSKFWTSGKNKQIMMPNLTLLRCLFKACGKQEAQKPTRGEVLSNESVDIRKKNINS